MTKKAQLKAALEQNGTAGAALLLEVFNYFDEALTTAVATAVGKLSDLQTTDKTNVVAAINEVAATVGKLSDLQTTDKTNVVAAINEVASAS